MTTDWGMKATGLYCLSVLETRCLSSRCHQGWFYPEAPGEGPSCLFQLLGAPGVPGLVAPSLPSLPSIFMGLILCVWVSPLLSLRRTLSLDVGPPPSRGTASQILHFITSAKTLFPHKVIHIPRYWELGPGHIFSGGVGITIPPAIVRKLIVFGRLLL